MKLDSSRISEILKHAVAVSMIVALALLLLSGISPKEKGIIKQPIINNILNSVPLVKNTAVEKPDINLTRYESFLNEAAKHMEIVQSFIEMRDYYQSASIDDNAYKNEANIYANELTESLNAIKLTIAKIEHDAFRSKADQWCEGCEKINEGIRLINSGLESKNNSTIDTGNRIMQIGLRIIDEADISHYR